MYRVLYFASGEPDLPAATVPKKVKKSKVDASTESVKDTAEGVRKRTKKVVQ
jgi:hypothetical protein